MYPLYSRKQSRQHHVSAFTVSVAHAVCSSLLMTLWLTIPGSLCYMWTIAPSSLAHLHEGLSQLKHITSDYEQYERTHSFTVTLQTINIVKFSVSAIAEPCSSLIAILVFDLFILVSWILPRLWYSVFLFARPCFRRLILFLPADSVPLPSVY